MSRTLFVALDEGALEVEGFVVDVETDDLPVWDVDDGLAMRSEAERPFAIGNGPGPVEAIDEGTVLIRRATFLEGAAHAQVAIGRGEDSLGLGNFLRLSRPPTTRQSWIGKMSSGGSTGSCRIIGPGLEPISSGSARPGP